MKAMGNRMARVGGRMAKVGRLLLAIPWIGLGASIVSASEPLVFYSGGKAHPLVKSSTEFAVHLKPAGREGALAKLAADPKCTVEVVPWAPNAKNHCLLHTPSANLARRRGLGAIAGVESVRPVYRFVDSTEPLLSTGTLVLRLDGSLTAGERTQFFGDFKVEIVNVIDPETHVYTVRPVGDPQDDEVRTASAMYRDDRTLFAHPNFIVRRETRQVIEQVDDEFFNEQWHLRNTGQGLGTPGADINIVDAWAVTFGEDVVVGIYDDAVDVGHEDLSSNYTSFGHDASTAAESPFAPNPLNSFDVHGTSVLGLAVADGNSVGIRGVAPAARFAATRGLLDAASLGQDASAFTFARQKNVDVHIDSWGFPGIPNTQVDVVVDAIRNAFSLGRGGRGMVVLFASGNDGVELGPDDDLSTLPEVIGIGASNADDVLASFSNFGAQIDMLAPSGDAFLPGMATTDVTDGAGFSAFGFNDGGGQDVFGSPDLPDGRYTQNFSGTSAACPVAAGVAALVLSRNRELTAEQVRTILAQTCEKINPLEAGYHPITEFSLRYGYGRINAGAAVEEASNSTNTDLTWPEPLLSIRITGSQIIWTVGDAVREIDHDNNEDTPVLELGDKTVATLVVESNSPFSTTNAFLPEDGARYTAGEEVATGITVVNNAENDSTNFTLGGSAATKYYALFPRNATRRFGFGVTIDTDGNVEGIVGSADGGGGSTTPVSVGKPRVSIRVSPLSGSSPLDVEFKGNALSDNPIESSSWDFDDDQTSTQSTTTHRYETNGGQSRRFFPSFLVTDDQGNIGTRTVAIDVFGADGAGDQGEEGEIRIVIGLPGSVGSNVNGGTSPFSVDLNIAGTPVNGNVESVMWDLGDGTRAATISVPHTYINNTQEAQTLPISVEVTISTPNGTIIRQVATRFITIEPDPNPSPAESTTTAVDASSPATNAVEQPSSDPGVPSMCGAGAMITMGSMFCLALIRRRLT